MHSQHFFLRPFDLAGIAQSSRAVCPCSSIRTLTCNILSACWHVLFCQLRFPFESVCTFATNPARSVTKLRHIVSQRQPYFYRTLQPVLCMSTPNATLMWMIAMFALCVVVDADTRCGTAAPKRGWCSRSCLCILGSSCEAAPLTSISQIVFQVVLRATPTQLSLIKHCLLKNSRNSVQ
jgi:hypothetical protein